MFKNKKYIFSILAIILVISMVSKYTFALENEENEECKFKVCIDPGHQLKGDNTPETVAPNSNSKKVRVTSGTSGIASKKAEHVVNLEAALILRDLLVDKNYDVIMTRECSQVNISNRERAEIANRENADITIRIHCDSINDGSKTGTVILVPSKENNCTKEIYKDSMDFASLLKDNLIKDGIKVNGIFERSDITGFNWSSVPVVILEMGFMSNYNEDLMLNDPEYQNKLMTCVANAIDAYKEINNS